MTLNEIIPLIPALLAGIALGAVFFIGLYLTTRKALAHPKPLLLLAASFLARAAIVVAGIWAVSGGDYRKILAALLGFIIARMSANLLLPPAGKEKKA